ncbi:iron-sulfur cluster insertion protein ErpA [Gluconobacter wancherniae]|uniref:Heme biosynthesis protein HemY n=1 Tax=Gluconobacter wancherniae NBRC 103581 TaxID=656744 RepID=A0A511AWV6_9PROT|nr:iron-sulfur cluster insertion protein ErpA [Gluconobacter wancherniae]MBF0852811.1 iron-sulfur cluster insertion protein ErpA [Gluconobacter wancherniae]MBS1087698.1 iron-sulfur cluster insertion protein ErpA [Gluconobacter wancherniae]MBS1093380.1 iron-sulfur cluster insertion protein ErpA [Gluconobacter wancherniae]GBD56473.1 heme biosynthesis protein HemY [Gluconobacter wancherniae NBRC 103581]GBR63936.1 iron-sulfur cluster assembly protein HesB/YadR/YfhF [Gluconobacter wancherniae NBRC 
MSDTAAFSLSASAAARIAEIVSAQPDQTGLALRVSVLAGGCNGFQYQFKLDSTVEPDDVHIERDGARVVVDPTSLELLEGAELDFIDKLMGAHFAVTNPNAASSCGCGTSFSLA